jgi:hypothetical protein
MRTEVNAWLGQLWKRRAERTDGPAPSRRSRPQWSDAVIQQVSQAAQRAFELYDEVDLRVERGLAEQSTVILTCAVSQDRLDAPEANGRRTTRAQRAEEIRQILDTPLPQVPTRRRRLQWTRTSPGTPDLSTTLEISCRELLAGPQPRVEFHIAGLSHAQARLIQEQVEEIEAPSPLVLKPSEVALIAGVPAAVLVVLALVTSIPLFSIAEVALVGLAAVAATLRSPALARVVSHPVFAWFAVLVGGIALLPWGITQGSAASGPLGAAQAVVQLIAIPAVSAVGVVIGVRALSRGVKAAEEMRTLAWKLGALDAAMARLVEVEKDLKRLQAGLTRLADVAPFDDNPRHLSDLLRPGGAVDRTSAAVKLAIAFVKDLRDERPMRIAAAEHSSREAQHDFDPHKAARIRRDIQNAEARADAALREATERAEELRGHAAFTLLSGQLQELVNPRAAWAPAGSGSGQEVPKARQLLAILDDAKQDVTALRWLVALTLDPGSPPEAQRRRQRVERFLREYPEYSELVDRIEAQTFDAVRVVQASPRYWINEARGKPTLTARDKALQRAAGSLVFPALLWSFGITTAAELTVTIVLRGGATDLASALWGCTAGILSAAAPLLLLYLSNVRLGSYAFNVAPLIHEQISTRSEAGFYTEPGNAALCVERAEKVIRPLLPQETKEYVATSIQSIQKMIKTLAQLEHLELPAQKVLDLYDDDWELLKAQSLLLRSSPEVTVKRTRPVPEERTYRYDAREPSHPEARRRRRMAVKQLSFDLLRAAFERAEITNRDIWNMIQDHPSAQDGSVFPRDILRGKLAERIARLVDEADAQGVFRPFIGVKDLFGGLDGAANAGSKVTHIADMPSSELVKGLVKLGFLPIPVGLSAGANAGTGLENGHSAVGNPLHRGYDTGGSSSSCAYLLGLPDFPIHLYIGTDTGGSVSAPIGALQQGCAYISKWIPRAGMLPYSTTLDTVGVMGRNQAEVLKTALSLISPEHMDLHLTPSRAPPIYYVFESDLELPLLKQDDPLAKEVIAKFTKVVQRLDAAGRVRWLDSRYDGWREFPLDSYRVSYVEALYTLFNPAQKNRHGEPTRIVLDSNLLNRMARALVLLKHVLRVEVVKLGQMRLAGKSLFQIFRELRNAYSKLHEEKWPKNAVLLQPAPIPVRLDEFRTGGVGGSLTDDHDRTGMQKQIQFGWDQFISGEDGYVVTGRPEYVLHVVLTNEASSGRPDGGYTESFAAARTQVWQMRGAGMR